MLRNMKIRGKLILAFAVVLVIANLSGIISIFNMDEINEEYSFAMDNYGFAQGDVGKVLSCFASINVSVHDAISYTHLEDTEAAKQMFETQTAKMEDYFNNVEKTIHDDTEIENFKKAKDAWEEYLPLSKSLMKEGDTDDAAVVETVQRKLVNELDPLYSTIYNSLADVMADKVEDGNRVKAELTKSINQTIIFMILLVAGTLVVALIFCTSIAKAIADPIHSCATRLRELVKGDLTSPVPKYDTRDEIGVLSRSTTELVEGLNEIIQDEKYLLGEMARGNFDIHSRNLERYVGDFKEVIEAIRTINYRLSDTLFQINSSSDEVSSGAQQVSDASQNLSQGAAEQANSVEQLAHTIEEISAQVKNTADNAQIASHKAQSVGEEMTESNRNMQQMMEAMGDISGSSKEIGKIIKAIEDIAFQTNILALNAAVEAARAGTAGKGFAVVADEVRSLASKSAEASKDTASLIEKSIKAVENGTKIADQTASSLLGAVKGAKEVVSVIDKISVATLEQSQSVEQITQHVEQISGVVQNTSANAEESAASSEELSGQATMLKELVGRFRLQSRKRN